jgi:hypothetical protein
LLIVIFKQRVFQRDGQQITLVTVFGVFLDGFSPLLDHLSNEIAHLILVESDVAVKSTNMEGG